MKKLYFVLGFILIALTACPQKAAQTFDEIILVKKGIMFEDGSIQLKAALSGSGTVTWVNVTGKPLTYPADWNNIINKPLTYPADWNTMINKPGDAYLKDEIPKLEYLPLPQKTTAQIAAIVGMPEGAEVWDITLHVKKIFDGKNWSIVVLSK